jgi:hypothetical protein
MPTTGLEWEQSLFPWTFNLRSKIVFSMGWVS